MEKKKYEGFTLFELLVSVAFIGIMMASLMLPVPAQAIDLTSGLKLNIEAGIGPTFNIDSDFQGDPQTATLSHKKHEWIANAGVSVTIADFVEPYWEYKTITNVFSDREYGVKVMIPWDAADLGVQIGQYTRDNYKASEEKVSYGKLHFRL